MNAFHLFRHWETELRPTTLAALRGMTLDQLKWKPEGWHSSAWDLAVHMCNIEWVWIYRNVLRVEPWEARWGSRQFDTLDDLLGYWDKIHAASLQWLQEAPVTALSQEYSLPYEQCQRAPMDWIVYHVLEHEIHHRGQIFMLMRLQGLTPPEL